MDEAPAVPTSSSAAASSASRWPASCRGRPGRTRTVLEAASAVGTGQTGANSGVIHAGIYYAPGSLKARCAWPAPGRCTPTARHRIPHQRCGKLIVARDEASSAHSTSSNGAGARTRCRACGVWASEIAEIEPHACGTAALHSPETGIVDFGAVATPRWRRAGGRRRAGGHECAVAGIDGATAASSSPRHGGTEPASPCSVPARPRTAWPQAAGAPADPRIVPFRGAYLYLRAPKRDLVRG